MFKHYVRQRELEGTTVYSGLIRFMDGKRLVWSENTGIFRTNFKDALEDAQKLANNHWLLNK